MSSPRYKKYSHRLKAWLALHLIQISAKLSLASAQRIGRGFGWLLYHTDNSNRRTARVNIARCLPEKSPAEQEALVRDCMNQLGQVAMESGVAWLWPIADVRALIVEVTGQDLFDAAKASGKGLIIAGPHLGNWEVMGAWVAARTELTGLYRPPKIPALGDVITQSRERLPVAMVPADQTGVKYLLQALKAGKAIYALSDHEPSKGIGVFAPFFGQPAYSGNLVPKLAQRTGATVLLCCAERLPNAAGFRLHFRPCPAVPREADDVASATLLNDALADLIREFPGQFLWNYKRFRTQPEGAPRFYQ